MLVRRVHGKGHAYYADNAEGPPTTLRGLEGYVKLPGVTTILDQRPKPGLIDWAARCGAEWAIDNLARVRSRATPAHVVYDGIYKARFAVSGQAAAKGTTVHRLAEALVAGREVEVPEPLRGYVDSYVDWLDREDVEPLAVEVTVCNREVRYCGTADLVAYVRGEPALVEVKSGAAVYAESALQAVAYARAETYTSAEDQGREHPLKDLANLQRGYVLHVRPDGWDLRPLDIGDGPWDWFTRLAWLHWHADEADSWVGEALEPLALRAAS
jgi:ribosome-associated translation inhibitor RaiA